MPDSRLPTPETLEVKRRGRHRLIGAITLAVLAVVAIPMMLDSEPRKVSKELALNIPARDTLPALSPPDEKPAARAAEAAAGAAPAASVSGQASPVAEPAGKPASGDPGPDKRTDKTSDKAGEKTPARVETVKPGEPSRGDKPSAPRAADKPALKTADKVTEKVAEKSADKSADKAVSKTPEKSDSKALPSTEGFVIQLGAFSDADKLAALKAKMKAAKVAVFTEEVQTSTGKLTRLRAGPYKTREQADKSLAAIRKAGGEGKVVPLS